MKAVMYGAGNIGRGFIGALFSQAGYEVTFIDVNTEVVRQLNERGEYPLRIVSSEGFEDITISNVRAVNGSDGKAAADAIADCDIMATAVGANILKLIAPNIAGGISQRESPLDIIICENLMDAGKRMAELLGEELCERTGLVEASIGRMVPVQTEEMKDGDPLRVCVESYALLPVDSSAFKNEIPDIPGIIPYSPFGFYIRRKLYVHNLGHAVLAYLGLCGGKKFIHEAIADDAIYSVVRAAMLESITALALEYNIEQDELLTHVEDLLHRFTNKALGDTCARVGADIRRKLSAEDRLIGAASLCLRHGISPENIAIGAAAALRLEGGDPGVILREYSGLSVDSELYLMIMKNI